MGVGRDNITGEFQITNKKMDNSQRITEVRTSARPLKTLKTVSLLEEGKFLGKAVEIIWDENGQDYKIRYVTDSKEESLNIVCKLLYLQVDLNPTIGFPQKLMTDSHAAIAGYGKTSEPPSANEPAHQRAAGSTGHKSTC